MYLSWQTQHRLLWILLTFAQQDPPKVLTSFSELRGSQQMSEEYATMQEQIFRVMYAAELRKKRENELHDERRRVNYQEGKTPGRRGEVIMQDEISKETIRRHYLNQKG
jgi:hypothetical protein